VSGLAAESLFGTALEDGPEAAQRLDEDDELSRFRDRFDLPRDASGGPAVYLAGHSLGPLPREAGAAVRAEIQRWAGRGVEGWFEEPGAWFTADERHLPAVASMVGARTHEVAVMNGLTLNLHLLLASFFRPAGERRRVLVERPCFPSDRYALETHLRWHGLDPGAEILHVRPRDGTSLVEESDIEEALHACGERIALVLLSAVNFHTGQWLDIPRLAAAAREAGAVVGLDLAHAVGNVPLSLHDWDVDFAVWCHYKYVNAGPGAPGGVFVHERHAIEGRPGRLAGWWGDDPATRFQMCTEAEFEPRPGALGWQVSTPGMLGLAPLGPALSLFLEADPAALRARSKRLTAYLEWLLDRRCGRRMRLLTPRDPERRGAQLSLSVEGRARRVNEALRRAGIVGDFRGPDVLRLAPAPLFNTYHEMWRTAEALGETLEALT